MNGKVRASPSAAVVCAKSSRLKPSQRRRRPDRVDGSRIVVAADGGQDGDRAATSCCTPTVARCPRTRWSCRDRRATNCARSPACRRIEAEDPRVVVRRRYRRSTPVKLKNRSLGAVQRELALEEPLAAVVGAIGPRRRPARDRSEKAPWAKRSLPGRDDDGAERRSRRTADSRRTSRDCRRGCSSSAVYSAKLLNELRFTGA